MNGKALVNGVKLLEMDAADMLDVVHYFFEEDILRFSNSEHAEAGSRVRVSIYENMYDREYKYEFISSEKDSNDGGRSYISDDIDDPLNDLTPMTTKPKKLKPYIPPTDFDPDSYNPFGSVLDSPIN